MMTASAAENTTPAASTEVKPSPATSQQISPPPVISPSGKPGSNAIGCILPLSGKYADWGNKALNAIELSAGISNKENNPPWEVIVEDSQGSPEKTKAAVATLAENKTCWRSSR